MLEQQHDGDTTVSDRAKQKLVRDLGPLVMAALADPKTVEVLLNPDGRLWHERLGEPMQCIGTLSASRAEAAIRTIAGYYAKVVTRDAPLLEGELPLDGSRFAGQLPPVVAAPAFAIRKRAIAVFSLDDYVAAGIMTPAQCAAIKAAIQAHRNILVVGGTGSGKTTLINAIIREMVAGNPHERVVIIEDTGEIQCEAPNVVQYHTTLDVSMTQLLRVTLRMRPDRILVGEVRGPEALDLLMAWTTGHEGGAATLHANSADGGLTKLETYISMNRSAPAAVAPLIAEAVHVVVHITRTPEGRRVQEVLQVQGYAHSRYITQPL